MNEPFDLPVTYNGKDLFFSAHLQQVGYSHRIVVDVYGQAVYFEPDEERNYRALFEEDHQNKQVTNALLKAIAQSIEVIVK
jgi:hypothetical protein